MGQPDRKGEFRAWLEDKSIIFNHLKRRPP